MNLETPAEQPVMNDLTAAPETVTSETLTASPCPVCQHQPAIEDAFCESCGYPLKGTEEEQNLFVNNRNYKHVELQDMHTKIKKATNYLYVLSSFTVLSGIFYYAVTAEEDSPMALLVTDIVLAVIYLGLALWSKKQPLAAIVSALSLFAVIQILNGIVEPMSLFKGILFKIFVVVYLIKGVQSALEAQKIKKHLNLE